MARTAPIAKHFSLAAVNAIDGLPISAEDLFPLDIEWNAS